MPAKKPDGGVNPVEKPEATNKEFPFTPITPRAWFSDRLLLLVVAVFLLVLVSLPGLLSEGKSSLRQILNQTPAQKIGLSNTSKLFESKLDSQRFDKFIASNNLVKAYLYLSDEYLRSPSADKRQVLIKLADYIKVHSADQARNVDLTIPCREESCGAVFSYSDDLSNIKNALEKTNALDSDVKSTILFNLETAALAKGKNDDIGYFNSLYSAFQKLREDWLKTHSNEVKNLASSILSLIQKDDPSFYQLLLKKGSLNL